MEHLADKLDCRGLVGVLFLKVHNESEGSILEGSIGRSDNNGIPIVKRSATHRLFSQPGGLYQVITLSATGEADTPVGGSVCMRCDFCQSSI